MKSQYELNVEYILEDCRKMVLEGFLRAEEMPTEEDVRSLSASELSQMAKAWKDCNK